MQLMINDTAPQEDPLADLRNASRRIRRKMKAFNLLGGTLFSLSVLAFIVTLTAYASTGFENTIAAASVGLGLPLILFGAGNLAMRHRDNLLDQLVRIDTSIRLTRHLDLLRSNRPLLNTSNQRYHTFVPEERVIIELPAKNRQLATRDLKLFPLAVPASVAVPQTTTTEEASPTNTLQP